MTGFKIVAHRGVTDDAPENSMAAFERAIELGANAVELDVRLTRDQVPVVYHYFYLDVATDLAGPIFDYSCQQISQARLRTESATGGSHLGVPTLHEVLEGIGGRIGLEIEIKGPEREAPGIVGGLLRQYRRLWDNMEVTSYEPQLLLALHDSCPAIAVDLLVPRSEPWMDHDVVAYMAIHKARRAAARAVHLHPEQLSEGLVKMIRQVGLEIHAWDVNEESQLDLAVAHRIPQICTDRFAQAKAYRARLEAARGLAGDVNRSGDAS